MGTRLPPGPHLDLLLEALAGEADAQRLLLAGDLAGGRSAMRAVAELYWRSWECAPPRSFGRLVGMLKAAVLAGDAADAAERAWALTGEMASPPEAYAHAICALVLGDDAAAATAAERMRAGDGAFTRAADAIGALARGDAPAYANAVAAIVADFAGRDDHVTGVPIADTAAMLDHLAAPRGLHSGCVSPLLP